MRIYIQVGGIEEYHICEAIKTGRITKPVVAWCIGTCASMFTSEVITQLSMVYVYFFARNTSFILYFTGPIRTCWSLR